MNKIIAIVGMCGVGKSVAVEHIKNKGYALVYFGGITLDKMKEEGIEITPENERTMREGLRAKYGMGAYATLSLPKIKELIKSSDVIIDGLYSWDELKVLKEEFGELITVISIIADKNIRYERVSKREIRGLNNDQARTRDIAEIENMAKGGPIAYADYFVLNNGPAKEMEERIDDILEMIDNKNNLL